MTTLETESNANGSHVVTTLLAARTLITPINNWTQNAYARLANGEACGSYTDGAICFCGMGAVNYVIMEGNPKAIHKLLSDECGEEFMEYNDTHGHEDVLAVFDKTIERLKWNV